MPGMRHTETNVRLLELWSVHSGETAFLDTGFKNGTLMSASVLLPSTPQGIQFVPPQPGVRNVTSLFL